VRALSASPSSPVLARPALTHTLSRKRERARTTGEGGESTIASAATFGFVAAVTVTLVSAADANYWPLLHDLVLSVRAGEVGRGLALSVLDVGLALEHRRRLAELGAAVVEPGWDFRLPWADRVPGHQRALYARPFLPRYFPGHEIYLWVDSDAWVQDERVLRWFVEAARKGKLPIVPEIDRAYWTLYKRPRLWGQNQKMFAFCYGARAGYRLGRNPILNAGIWALAADAPHWAAWRRAIERALQRRRVTLPGKGDLRLDLVEQTALNAVVFEDRLPATFLPAYCNWFAGKGEPMWDERGYRLVEPHAPHEPIGIVHLAGKGMKQRVFQLRTLGGGTVSTRLTWSAVQELGRAREAA
jgi:hypothetical protein